MTRVLIEPLPSTLRSYLRTGVSITSITQCVEELVLNSVDAGATCIAVRVDPSCFKVQVVDNGDGIPHDQLEKLGIRFCTSKCHTLTDINNLCHYGYRGEALASIVDCCGKFEVVTRSKVDGKTYSKIFNNGGAVKSFQSANIRPSVGSTMTVCQLFINFPVRQKSMNQSHEIGRLRETLEGIALVKPGISFSLRNDANGQVILSTKKCLNICRTFSQLYGSTKADALVEVSGSKKTFKIHGYIGREGHQRKNLQFVYVNGRLVKKSKIHQLLKKILVNLPALKPKLRPLSKSPSVSGIKQFFSTPPKFSEAYPVFVLEVECPIHEYDITFDPAKTMVEFKDWDTLLSCVSEVTESFVKNESVFVLTSQSPVTKTAFVEDEQNEDAPVISADNLKDVLVSKAAKRISKEPNVGTAESLPLFKTSVSEVLLAEDHDVFKTPRNGDAIICQTAIGLGKRGMENDPAGDDENSFMVESNATSYDSCMNNNADSSVKHPDLNSAAVGDTPDKNEVTAANLVSSGHTDQPKPSKPDYQCSLSHYRESIGKSSCRTKFVSVDESLQKLHKIFPSTERLNPNRIVSSLQKFRSKFARKGNHDIDLRNKVNNDHSTVGSNLHHPAACFVSEMPDKNNGSSDDQVEAFVDDYHYHVGGLSQYSIEKTIDEGNNNERHSHELSDNNSDFIEIQNIECGPTYISSKQNVEPKMSSSSVNTKMAPVVLSGYNLKYTCTDLMKDCAASYKIENISNYQSIRYGNEESSSSCHLTESCLTRKFDSHFMVNEDSSGIVHGEKLSSIHVQNLGKRSANSGNTCSHETLRKKQCFYLARPDSGNIDDVGKQSPVANNCESYDSVCNINDCDNLSFQLDTAIVVQDSSNCDNSHCDNLNGMRVMNVDKTVVKECELKTKEHVNDTDKMIEHTEAEVDIMAERTEADKEQAVDDMDNMNATQAFTPHIEQELHDSPHMSDEGKPIHTPASLGFSPTTQHSDTFDSPVSTGFEIADSMDKHEEKSDEFSDYFNTNGFKNTDNSLKETVQSVANHSPAEYIPPDVENSDCGIDGSGKLLATCAGDSTLSNAFSPKPNTDFLNLKCDTVTITQLMKSPTQSVTQLDAAQVQNEYNYCSQLSGDKPGFSGDDLFSDMTSNWLNEHADGPSLNIIVPDDVIQSSPDDVSLFVSSGHCRTANKDQVSVEDAEGACGKCLVVNDNSDVLWSDCSWDSSEVMAGQVVQLADKTDALPANTESGNSSIQDAGAEKLKSVCEEGDGIINSNADDGMIHGVDSKNCGTKITGTEYRKEKIQSAPSELDLWFQNLDVITDKPSTSNVLQTDKPSDVVKKLHACRFSKQSLKSVKVLGQVDKKFIACLINTETDSDLETENKTMLILVDQHAAHERIRLEILTEEAFENGRGGKLTSYIVDEPQCLSFTEQEVRIILEFKDNYVKLGIDLERKSPTSLIIKTIPECLVYKEKNRIYWSTIQVLMREYLSVFMSTTASHGVLPQTIHKVLCSLACHGAIKFGDRLTGEDCTKLINDLSLCDLPFQCAHGRPSVMPLFDMDRLKPLSYTKSQRKPNLQKLKRDVSA